MKTENYICKTLIDVLYNQSKEIQKGIRFIKSSNEEEFISYSKFYNQVIKYLGTLQGTESLNKGDEVIIYEEDNHKFLIGFWACLLGGYIPVPVAVGGKEAHKLKFFRIWNNLTNPSIFTSRKNLEKLVAFKTKELELIDHFILEDNFLNSSEAFKGERMGVAVEVLPNDIAFIQYSSGSTGNPKGVILTHENLSYNIYDLKESFELDANDVFFCWIPLTHDMGMIAFHLTSLLTNCDQLIMPTNLFIRRPLLWMEKTNEHRASKLCSPNFGYQYFLLALNRKKENEIDWDLSSVETIINGAEPISAKICSDFTSALSKYKMHKHCISASYGLAEASVGVSVSKTKEPIREFYVYRNSLSIEDKIQFADEYCEEKTLNFVGVGETLLSTKVSINDEKGNPLGKNTLGFIDIKGKNITNGYYKNSEATKAVFVKNDWLRTGDLGFVIEDGTLVITGRHKNMIIIQGQNYYAHDIENMIIGTADISLGKVAVCGVSGNGEQKEKLLVFVYYKKKVTEFLNTIITIQERLSNAVGIIPEVIIPVREIPKTTSGKVQHSVLLNKYKEGDFNETINDINKAFVEYTIENWIASTNPIREISNWLEKQSKQLLHLKDLNINIDVPLADQGFKSIHALQLSQIIKTRLGIKATPTILYKYPTVYKLSEYIYNQLFNSDTLKENIIKDDTILLNEIESLSEEEVLKILEL